MNFKNLALAALTAFVICQPRPLAANTNTVSEPFDYAANTLLSTSGPVAGVDGVLRNWVKLLSISSSHITNINGNLTISGLAPSSGRMAFCPNNSSPGTFSLLRLAAATVTNQTEFFSFIFQVSNTAPQALALPLGVVSAGSIPVFDTDPAVVYLRGSAGNTFPYSIGLFVGGTTNQVFEPSPTHFRGDVIFVVLECNYATQTSSLYINPPADSFGAATPPLPTIGSTTATLGGWRYFSLANQNVAGAGAFNFDAFRCGPTWASVTPLPGTPPIITSVAPANPVMNYSSPLNFSCSASGSPPLSFFWTVNGIPAGVNASSVMLSASVVTNLLPVSVLVSNQFGTAISNFTAVVQPPPPPVITIVPGGTNLVLSVTNAVPNSAHVVLTATNATLPLTNWERLATNIAFPDGTFEYPWPPHLTNSSQRFFRIQFEY